MNLALHSLLSYLLHVVIIVCTSFFLFFFLGLDGSDAGLAAVIESLGFCMKLRCSEASILEYLEKAINLVHTRRDLVESGHALLDHAYKAQNEYERCGKGHASIFPFVFFVESLLICNAQVFLMLIQTRNQVPLQKIEL